MPISRRQFLPYSITRDLEEFKAKGMGEVLLVNSASLGNAKIPQGVRFLSAGMEGTVSSCA